MNIFKQIASWVDNFLTHILPSSKKLIDVATHAINAFKSFDAGHPEVLNMIVAAIPGIFDDAILAAVRRCVPEVLTDLKIVQDVVGKTDEQITAEGVDIVNDSPLKSVLLGSMWTALSNKLTQNGVSISDLQKVQQFNYEATADKIVN